MGMFHKVGDWLTDKSDRFIRGSAGSPGSYYASSEAEEAYGGMGVDLSQEPAETQETGKDTERMRSIDPFDRAGKDYGGRVPYRSQRDVQAEQAAMEMERQRQMREEQTRSFPPQQAMPPQSQAYGQQASYGQASYGQPAQGMPPQQPVQAMPKQQPPVAMPQQAPVFAQPGRGTPQASNVVPFPGMQHAADGTVFSHIEYVVLLRGRNECTKVIEYIKSNASVFLNMEFIASDSERQRCVDMLSGAAYTLGCKLSRISPRGIYLISSPSVHVVIDQSMQGFTTAPEAQGFVRQNYEAGGYGAQRQAGGYAAAQQPRMNAYAAQQGTQRRQPVAFAGMMAGDATGTYAAFGAGNATGRYPGVEYPQ